ncbi:hypothetical protein B0H15DRAFT_862489 [Mycena belliarum]|uniref:Uncharacterized protein n=1 Tax=Mycena belliarum TaxID=1033014 RepID=A0AAD6TUW2_9AGAR|nr:hypothetical protein B0H15DRAFT_862489 [Mycena belliae]
MASRRSVRPTVLGLSVLTFQGSTRCPNIRYQLIERGAGWRTLFFGRRSRMRTHPAPSVSGAGLDLVRQATGAIRPAHLDPNRREPRRTRHSRYVRPPAHCRPEPSALGYAKARSNRQAFMLAKFAHEPLTLNCEELTLTQPHHWQSGTAMIGPSINLFL